MTKEQKELLLKDLCSRLPYGVKGVNKAGIVTDPSDWYCGFVRLSKELENRICYSDWRPYLFPLSSMTEEQKTYISNRWGVNENFDFEINPNWGEYFVDLGDAIKFINWLNENHFDYRGLISKGLAIDATNLNIY